MRLLSIRGIDEMQEKMCALMKTVHGQTRDVYVGEMLGCEESHK